MQKAVNDVIDTRYMETMIYGKYVTGYFPVKHLHLYNNKTYAELFI